MLARARAWIRRTPAPPPGGRSIIARALATTTSACGIASPSCRRPTAIGLQGSRGRHRGLRRGGAACLCEAHQADPSLTSKADQAVAPPRRAVAKPVEQGVEFEVRALPDTVAILAGDVRKELNPRSGQEMLQMTDMAVPVQMRDYGVFAATEDAPAASRLGHSAGDRHQPPHGRRPRSPAVAWDPDRDHPRRHADGRGPLRHQRHLTCASLSQGRQEARISGDPRARLAPRRYRLNLVPPTSRWLVWRSTSSRPTATMGLRRGT